VKNVQTEGEHARSYDTAGIGGGLGTLSHYPMASAQMANHDLGVHLLRLLSYGAMLVPSVFVLLTSSPDG
jgi:hypothetical protein